MIRVIESAEEMFSLVQQEKNEGKSIGFVPTMGALHTGHISLAKRCSRNNMFSVVSIFVNPTQFNDIKDLEKYARNLPLDLEKLERSGIDVVFAPTVAEIYPDGQNEGAEIDLGGLDTFMEGKFRPGHFKGMAQVVKRLLDIVTPDNLYMGQKDFQQFTIVDYMIKSLEIKTRLVVCPIIREKNGLAMSSRNERLSSEAREKAKIIFKTLSLIKRYKSKKSPSELITYGLKKLNSGPFELEYLEIVDGYTLNSVSDFEQTKYAVVCVAVWVEGIRLIDNLNLYKN